MGALLVIARAPTRQSVSGVSEIVEDRLIEQFVAHSAIERFADPVLHRLARRDEMPGDLALLRPGEHCVRGELGSMVGDDQVRPAALGDDGVEFAGDASPRDRGVRNRGQAFLRDVVDHIEDPEASTVRELVVDEVDRPARVRAHLD